MPKRINLHVVSRNEGWVVRKDGNSRALSVHTTQREAIDAARQLARSKQGELIIHGKDGRINNRRSYNPDPLPPKSAGKVLFHETLNEKDKKAIQASVRNALKKSNRKSSHHVIPHRRGWVVRGEGKTPYSSVYDTQREAIEAAKKLSRKTDGELLIHNKHREIRGGISVAQKARSTRPQ